MPSINISQADAEIINIERKKHTHALIRDRMYVLHLINLGYKRKDCAAIVGCSINSVRNYINMYKEGGLELIRKLRYKNSRHELADQYAEVEKELEAANFSTVKEAGSILRTKFGYTKSLEAVRCLLHRLGFKRRKTGSFPGNIKNFDKWQHEQKQAIKKLYKLIDKAENEKLILLFSDAAHFVYGKFSSYHWGKSPRFAPSGHGRFRLNVYGSYDVISNQVYSMYNDGYINAEFMVQYFEWLRKEIYTDHSQAIHMVMDNARYQHCNYVKEKASELNIVLEFLPGYSPNLNLIERLWKYMKKIVGQTYHQSKESFKKEIVNLLSSLNSKEHQDNIWTLLNPVFQQYEKSQILTR